MAIIEITFQKSSSPSYTEAVELSQRANEYHQAGKGRAMKHTARFQGTRDQIAIAYDLLNLISSTKRVRVKINGIPERVHWETMKTMECYLKSHIVSDHRTYCWDLGPRSDPPKSSLMSARIGMDDDGLDSMRKNVDIMDEVEATRIGTPCRFLKVKHKQGNLTNQFQTESIHQGVWWCPHLKTDEFLKLTF